MRKRAKKLLSTLLCGTMLCLYLPFQAQAVQFSDVSANAWYYTAISSLSDKGILSGTGGGKFSPTATLTRGQFVTMLAKSTLSANDLQPYNFSGYFKDVTASHWATPFVNWAYETRVASGYEDGTFQPDKAVTRQEMAVMVNNLAKSTGKKFPAINQATAFKDQRQIASWATQSVSLCQQADVINGDGDTGNFRPESPASRAEAASICYKYLQNVSGNGNGYSIYQKRVNGIAVRAVVFSPSGYTPGLVMGQDMVDGGESSTSLIQRTGAFIAVNGAFFNMYDYTPLGTLISDGRILTVDNTYAPEKAALVVSPTGEYSVESFETQITTSLVDTAGNTVDTFQDVVVNRWPGSDTDGARLIMTRDWGTRLNFSTWKAVVVDGTGTITGVYTDQENVDIPQDGFVLCQKAPRVYESDFFPSCQVGMKIMVSTQFQTITGENLSYTPTISIGAGPRIVKDGAVYGGYSTYRQEGFSDGVTSGDAERVCVGIQDNGSLVILEASASVPQLAQLMVAFGCRDAVNLDGGGSVNLYVDGYWLYGPQGRPLNSMLYFTK